MDLGNVHKYDIDTLKSLHNELNEANVESGGWIATATDEKIYTIFKGGRLVVTSRFTYHPTDTPTYCTSPYRPNLVEWKNGNSQDDETEEEKEVELVTTITKKSPITTTSNELNTFSQPSITTPPFHETDNKLEEIKSSTKKFSSVYFDESFTKYHRLISAAEMPRFKLCVLIRYSLGMLITRCKEIWNRLPVKTDLDTLAKEIVEYYPSLSKKAVRRKLAKRFLNLKANTSNAEKREEKKSSNKLVDKRPSSLVEQQEQAAVSECCLEDDTKTSSNNDDDDDNLPVFPIDKAYCDFDLSNIVYGRRLRGGKRRCGKKEKEER